MPWHRPFPRAYGCDDDDLYDTYANLYRWPYYKFGKALKPEDIWGHLHERFNTVPMTILDKPAWHADLNELIKKSETLEEFYALLEERKKLRLDELKSAIAYAVMLNSAWLKLGTPFQRLAIAMTQFHKSASVFDAASAFMAMQDVVKEQDEKEQIGKYYAQ